ncbi:uncharacterized protein TNCT_484641 [Trichonephila clavata]|uniref:Uncharacterized protein n=1 Tax=Trichonephila clavata TaxID=2740835 RepID=A0A8X6HYV0_TRICU|nr:uncharacterized protein TNCT_484641 [Trichonephila clavata]
MTEHLNGQIEQVQNGFHSTESEPFLLTNGQTKENNLTVAKNPRKKVSFHDNVTDIDEESSLQNGNHQEKKDEDTPSLDGILNVSEKINYFLTAFAPESQTKGKNSLKPHGHQSSIPEARLAFVTEMVESSLAGNDSRADSVRGDSNSTANMDQEDEGDIGPGREAEHVCQVTDTPDAVGSLESQIVNTLDMAATQVTFMKIFAPQKKAVVEREYFIFEIIEKCNE